MAEINVVRKAPEPVLPPVDYVVLKLTESELWAITNCLYDGGKSNNGKYSVPDQRKLYWDLINRFNDDGKLH